MKTAMQELENKLKDNLKWIVMNADYELMDKLFQEGLEKEKKQIAKAFNDRAKPYPYEGDENWEVLDCTGEFYYNHTYNQNK